MMLKNIFYWIYYYRCRIVKDKDSEGVSCLLLSVFMLFNVTTIFIMLNYFFDFYHGESFPWDTGKGKYSIEGLITGLVITFPFLIFNYIYIYRKRKEIIKKYKNIKGNARAKSKTFFWLYTLFSVFLFFYSICVFSTRAEDGYIRYDNKHQHEYYFPSDSDSIIIQNDSVGFNDTFMFENAACVNLGIDYTQKGESYITTSLTIQVERLIFDNGMDFDNFWVK